jgi:hypothetical protein
METKVKCANELECTHGRQVSRRFLTMLENREQANGTSLSDKEVEDLKIRFDAEIYSEILRKGGK